MKIKYLFLLIVFSTVANKLLGNSKNVIKTSVIPIFFKNYSLYFERAIHKNISFSFGGSFSPTREFPEFASTFINDATNSLPNTSFKGFSMTPEFRIYPGLKLIKEAPRGFYIALYAKFSSYQVDFPFHYTENNTSFSFDFTGNYTGTGIGMMLGHQWIVADHFSLDWWMAGAHFGNLNSTLEVTNNNLTTINQVEFINDIGDIDFPQGELETQITGNKAKITFDAPFVGIRLGLTLGIAF